MQYIRWILLGLCLFASSACISECGSSADGRHTVYVTAVEKSGGLVFDDVLVYVKSSLESSQEEKYCVNDAALQAKLETFAASKARVTIHYQNGIVMWMSECANGQSVIVDAALATQ